MLKQKLFLGAIGACVLSISAGAIMVYAQTSIVIPTVTLNAAPGKTAEKLYSDAIKSCNTAFNAEMGLTTDTTKPNGKYAKAVADAKAKYKIVADSLTAASKQYKEAKVGSVEKEAYLKNVNNMKANLQIASATLSKETLDAKNRFDSLKKPIAEKLTACKARLDAPTTGFYTIYKKAVSTAQNQLKIDQKNVTNKFTNTKIEAIKAFETAIK